MKRPASVSYKEDLLERLKDIEYSASYLNLALEDEDPRVFLLALKDVIEAHGGIGKASKKAELSRESMYKTLSGKKDPRISTVAKMLDSVGIELKTYPKPR